jgi:hypothetical protein
VAKEHFAHKGSENLLRLLDEAGHKGQASRGQAFSDFLEVVICALSGQQMEDRYLEIAKRYSEGTKGSRGIDRMAEAFGLLVNQMEETRADILGDIFQGGITYGEHGQFYTPESVTDLMSQMTTEHDPEVRSVSDPCCGSGRMLLAIAKINPHWRFHGQDIDIRCVRMCAINLAFRNLAGFVTHGDTLRNERRLIYQTGFNGKGFVREIPIPEAPPPPEPMRLAPETEPRSDTREVVQGSLFD